MTKSLLGYGVLAGPLYVIVVLAQALLHIGPAGVGFLGLVAACFVFARRSAREARRGGMWFSLATGIVFLLAFLGLASGSDSPVIVLPFWPAPVPAWAWIAALSVRLY